MVTTAHKTRDKNEDIPSHVFLPMIQLDSQRSEWAGLTVPPPILPCRPGEKNEGAFRGQCSCLTTS